MRVLVYILFIIGGLFMFGGCKQTASRHTDSMPADSSNVKVQDNISPETDITIIKELNKSETIGTDSLLSYILLMDSTKRRIFDIATGGNIECLDDTIFNLDEVNLAVFTIADYSQIDQMYYVIYDINKDTRLQSARINLPDIGMRISEWKKLSIGEVETDSILITSSDKKTRFRVESMKLDCDSNRIINYYEYQ